MISTKHFQRINDIMELAINLFYSLENGIEKLYTQKIQSDQKPIRSIEISKFFYCTVQSPSV